MHQSYKRRQIKQEHNKQFYKNSLRYSFGSLLLCDIIIFSYDFGTATFQHVILPNGHCNYFGQMEYATIGIAHAYSALSKIIQIILLVVYFVYYYQLNKMLKMVRSLAVNGDHQQNQLFFKLAITMAAAIGISQFLFAYNRLINPLAIVGIVGTILLLIQQSVFIFLFTSSKKVSQLCKERFCTTGTSS